MKRYQIVYESGEGNTRSIAEAIMVVFPAGSVELVDINTKTPSRDADAYCVGYGVHFGFCSMKLMDFMKQLNGKTVLLFATCGLTPAGAYKKYLERNMKPFLPDCCNYKGMFLCQGAISDGGAAALRSSFKRVEDEKRLERLEDLIICARTHPDFDDMDTAGSFVKTSLKL